MKTHIKGFVLGVLTTLVLMGVTVAYAAGGTSIEVYYKSLRYMFDGVEKTSTSGQGFIYKGTTYVPLRFMGESLGKEVSYVADTGTIWVGSKPKTTTPAPAPTPKPIKNAATGVQSYLSDLPTMSAQDEATSINIDEWGSVAHNTAEHTTFTIAGKEYKKGFGLYLHNNPYPPNIKTGGTLEYTLNGKYTRLIGYVGADDSTLMNTAKGTFKIIGDGKELLLLQNIKAGEAAKKVDLDVTGIQTLRINFNSNRNGLINLIFADPTVTAVDSSSTENPQTEPAANQPGLIIVDRNTLAEYVIIKNTSKETIDLSGWSVVNANGLNTYKFENGTTLEEESYIMLLSGREGERYADTGVDTSGYEQYSRSFVWSTSQIWVDNGGDAAILYDTYGTKVSEYK